MLQPNSNVWSTCQSFDWLTCSVVVLLFAAPLAGFVELFRDCLTASVVDLLVLPVLAGYLNYLTINII
jgi:hypothetical protein